MPHVGKKSFAYSAAGKKKAKAYASKTGKSVKMSNSKSTVGKKK